MAFDLLSRERLIAYLLGELPPPELAEIDRRLLKDEAFGDLLEEARNDVLDAYTLGTLPEAQRERARRALNLPPGGQGAQGGQSAQAGFARALSRALRQTPQASAIRSRLPKSRRVELWAGALAACMVAGLGLWLALRGAVPAGGSSRPDATFVLLLRPTVLRGPGPEQIVRLPAGLRALETQIVVPDSGGRYEVEVESASGQSAYPGLVPQSLGAVSFVQLAIARDRLPPGSYRFLLLQTAPGPARPLSRYTVHVIAP